ncbi:MAG: transporter substrate-binding domain-containing protein [Ruminiclostridium sp.]|nr:transporter substrate-binding domain-containing protein [Ruminiclostridium sp.]
MKRMSLVLAVLVGLTALFNGCARPVAEQKPIRFGILPAESAIPIIIAKEKGFFDKEGLKVELVSFNSPNDRNVAVQAGQIDAIIADIMTSLTFHEAGLGMKITSDINEDFKLLTSPNSGIDTFAKLNGKDVSIVPNFVLEYIMDEMAAKNNIKYKPVSIPSFSARLEALMADRLSAVVFTEPQATMMITQGAKLLATSKEYGLKAGTLLFNEKTLSDRPKSVKAFYLAYNKAVNYINETDAAQYGGILTKYSFPDAVVKYLSGSVKYEKAQKISEESFKSVLEWTRAKGTVKKDYKLKDISNFNFIE